MSKFDVKWLVAPKEPAVSTVAHKEDSSSVSLIALLLFLRPVVALIILT